LCRSTEPDRNRADSGFTLIESLVTVAVVAVALTAIGMLIGANIRATHSLDERLALIETARAILSGLPDREQLEPGDSTGALADHRWRIDVMPFAADFVDPSTPSPWQPEAIVLRVQAPSGEILRIDTVRLRHSQGTGP
jgi:general secretion pathway protein I